MVHDDLGDLPQKLKNISECGYELIDHFMLSEETWWNEYYSPLEKLITQRKPQALSIQGLERRRTKEKSKI